MAFEVCAGFGPNSPCHMDGRAWCTLRPWVGEWVVSVSRCVCVRGTMTNSGVFCVVPVVVASCLEAP